MLRKDFIVNEYLVRETRAFGADLMLLIVAALEVSARKDLAKQIKEVGTAVKKGEVGTTAGKLKVS